MAKIQSIFLWIASIVAAIIMLQTLFFKFTGAAESIYIFSALGIEPWGRIWSGIVELIASILLLIPALRWMGALLGLGTMLGAMISHFMVLGIEVMNDGGQLFLYAVVTFISCLTILVIHRKEVQVFVNVYILRKADVDR